jgi:hypothetical protein
VVFIQRVVATGPPRRSVNQTKQTNKPVMESAPYIFGGAGLKNAQDGGLLNQRRDGVSVIRGYGGEWTI